LSRFRLFSHTADVGLTAWGPTIEDAYAATVRGFTAVTFDLKSIRPREARTVVVEGADRERLLVRLLDEELFLGETEGFLTARASIRLDGHHLAATLEGETFDPRRHRRHGPEVKAITYHQIAVDPGPPGRVRVILDI
jgi:SHS2 domain-containing protein